jgi:IS4 transposase
MLDHDQYMPAFVLISTAKQHDVKAARSLQLNPGSIVAMDRAYNDYLLFARWTEQGVFFVTRMKENAVYKVIRKNPLPQNRNILADEIIKLTGAKAEEKCPFQLRRVVVWDPEHQREIVLLTNHLDFGPTTIAAIYKDRWEIELFFKALKQTLKVKTFVGTTENALRIQIWTALIALLILKWLHHISKANWSFSNMADLVRLNLFTYRDLLQWLNDPYNTEPIAPRPEQLSLPFPGLGQAMAFAKG